MTTAATLFDIVQGDDFPVRLIFTDSLNAPVDLTGYQFYAQVRASPGAPLLGSFTFTVTPLAGIVDGLLSHTVTAAMPPSTEPFFGIKMVTPAGIRSRVLLGQLRVAPSITVIP